MRKNLFLLVTSLFLGAFLVAMEEEPLPPTPKEKINAFLLAKSQGRAGIRALATPRGESSEKTVIMRSDFRKTELEIYQQHVVSAIMKDELALKANTHLYIDEPIPTTLLLTGADGMRSGLLAKTLAKIVDADYQEILHWRAKGTLDIMKGFAVTGEEKRDKVILIRDIALLGRDLQGTKEQSYTVLYDQLKNSLKAIYQRKHQVDHRVYVVAATAHGEALPSEIKALFKKTYPLVISDTETAGAIVKDFVQALNGGSVELTKEFEQQLQGLSFDDLKDMVNDAAKEAAREESECITREHLAGVLATSKEHHEKIVADRASLLAKLLESQQPVAEKNKEESMYATWVECQTPANLRVLCEHRPKAHSCYHDSSVYVLTGERGLGKLTTARAIAERRNAELVVISAEDLLDPAVGKTQKNLEHFFEDLKQRAQEGKSCVAFLRGCERLFPANRFGDDEYEMRSLRVSLLARINDLGESTVLLLGADSKKEALHKELLTTVGVERCAEFTHPKDDALKEALLLSLSTRLLKQKEVSIDYAALAKKAEKFTCTDLERMVRSAGRKALNENASTVNQDHFNQALAEMLAVVKERADESIPKGMYT